MPSDHRTMAELVEENRALKERLAATDGDAAAARFRLAELAESTRDAMWCIDLDYRLLAANSVFGEEVAQWFGRPFEPGESVLAERFPSEVLDEWRKDYDRALAGETFTVERENPRATNHQWAEYQFQPVRDDAGEVVAATIQSRDITLRKSREEQISSQAMMLDHIQDAIIMTDLEGRITYVNDTACAARGVPREALIGKTVHALGDDPAEGATQDEIIERTRANGEWRGSVVNLTPDGRRIVLDCRTWVVCDAHGSPAGMIGISTDITGRRAIERALRESEERLRLLFDGSSELISLTDADARTLWANPAWKAVFGHFAERGEDPFLHIHPDDLERVSEAWSALVNEGKEIRHIAYRFRSGGLTYLHFESNAFPVITGEERLYYVVAHDVTERVRAEEALRGSEARFRNVFATMGSGVAVYEPVEGGRDFVFRDINPSGERLSKVRRNEVVGRRLTEIFPNVAAMGLLAKLRAAIHSGEPQYLPITQYEDERISQWVENHVFRLPSGEVVAVFEDVTERRQYEERLRESQGQLRALAAELAEAQEVERKRIARELHDHVGQTLSALGLNLNMALNRLPDEGAAYTRERLGRALALVEQTGRHIRDVIAALRPSVLDDYGVVPALRWYAGEVLRRSETPVVLEADDDLPRFDPPVETAMFRIAQEAIGNAVRHAKAHEIRVTVALRRSRVQMTIKDDGVGFDAAEPLPSAHGQSGWGMVTMRERARAVGGELLVESAPREGTQITLRVPV